MIIHVKDMNGIQEVSGSIPLISTTKKSCNLNGYRAFSFSEFRAGNQKCQQKVSTNFVTALFFYSVAALR